MSLRIEFDWEDPQAAKGPELRAGDVLIQLIL
jgi:hypothetical protein